MLTEADTRYQEALGQLSDLVRERDQLLLQLDTMASLPLSISPRSGHVAKFDTAHAQRLLEKIGRQSLRIEQMMETVNQYAEQVGLPKIEWLELPPPKADLVAADE